MPYEFITYEKTRSHGTITINRPEVCNALHPPANRELSAAFDEFAADPDAWVAIITGAGDKAFSAGNDLKYAPSTAWATCSWATAASAASRRASTCSSR